MPFGGLAVVIECLLQVSHGEAASWHLPYRITFLNAIDLEQIFTVFAFGGGRVSSFRVD